MGGEAQKVLTFFRAVPQIVPGGPSALSNIARGAGSHEITGRVVAALGPRLHMIHGEVLVGENPAAVDAPMAVPPKDDHAPALAPITRGHGKAWRPDEPSTPRPHTREPGSHLP